MPWLWIVYVRLFLFYNYSLTKHRSTATATSTISPRWASLCYTALRKWTVMQLHGRWCMRSRRYQTWFDSQLFHFLFTIFGSGLFASMISISHWVWHLFYLFSLSIYIYIFFFSIYSTGSDPFSFVPHDPVTVSSEILFPHNTVYSNIWIFGVGQKVLAFGPIKSIYFYGHRIPYYQRYTYYRTLFTSIPCTVNWSYSHIDRLHSEASDCTNASYWS